MAVKMQHRAIVTRRKILEAAITLFAEKGFNGTAVDDISLAAGANKQRIYAYFGSKRKLFEAALLEVFQRVKLFGSSTLEKAERDPENLSRIVLESFLKLHAEQPVLWRLLSWANLEGGESVKVLEAARRDENSALKVIFERAVAAGVIKQLNFESWLFILLGVSCFYYSNRHTLEYTLNDNLSAPEWQKQLVSDVQMLFSK